MSIDYRNFSHIGNGPNNSSSAGSLEQRWWTLDGQAAADSISSTLNRMKDNQTLRHTQWIISARLYGNLAPTSLAGVSFSKLATAQPALRDRVSYNVIQSVVDTIGSKIAKNRPRPLFLTNNGDYRQQRRAKGLNQFIDGVFYENETYPLGIKVFRDAAVWGDGFVHVFAENGRVKHERVLPSEIFVDDVEALYGEPRQMHRVKVVDRAVLAEMFPDHAEEIFNAPASKMEDTSRHNVADVLLVRESWHLPSGPDADDGKHCLSIDGLLLNEMEPWKHNFFPFARMQWTPRLFGFWGQGLAEQLMNIQLEINKLLWVIQRSFHLAGSFKVLLENGSKIVKEHINNDIGTIINYTGAPPSYVVPPTVPQEIFGHLNMLVGKAYEQAGVSQLSAGAVKPAGLNSGKALREMNDIESDRFMVIGKAYERLYMDVAKLSIATVKQIDEEGKYKVTVPTKNAIAHIKWADVNLEEDQYVMQCFPVSSLPNDPAGRLQTVQEYAQAGFLTPRQARRLLDFPDIEQIESLSNAAEEYLVSVLDKILDERVPVSKAYTPPDEMDDLALAAELSVEYYVRAKSQNVDPRRLLLIRDFYDQVISLQEKIAAEKMPSMPGMPEEPGLEAGAGPMPGGIEALLGGGPGAVAPPMAPPVRRTPSDLVPQVPLAS